VVELCPVSPHETLIWQANKH